MMRKTTHLVTLVACGIAATGCDVHQMGVHTSDTQAKSVDASWAKAARSCWPMLADKSDTYMKYNLAEPIVFRNTFPAYAFLGDSQIEKIVADSLTNAPEPDSSLFKNSNYPLLTRQAALSSGSESQTLTPDTLCAKHPGTPAEYR